MRLIDADYLKEMFDTACGTNREIFNVADAVYQFVIKIIDDAPTVDDKNETMSNIGAWIKANETTYMCSNCKAIVTGKENIKFQRFCYWCGKQLMPIYK